MALLDAKIDLLPYQIAPALASRSGRRRLLIADDVGLGKTIQAALLIAELARRDRSTRALLIVPGTLHAQWIDELASRFHLDAAVFDRESLSQHARAGASGESPWARPGIWLASVDFLKQPHVLAGLPLRAWDLVVVDEAHDVCGDSERHDACATICRRARRVLLLTATPHSGDQTRFERLSNLGRLPAAADELTVFRRTQHDAGMEVRRRTHWFRLSLTPTHLRVLDALAAFDLEVGARATASGPGGALLLAVFRKRALSTMSALAVTLERRLQILERREDGPVEPWHQETLPFASDDLGDDEREALVGDSGLPRARERSWLSKIRGLALLAVDTRIGHLRRLLSRTEEPVVIFTEFRQSLEVLQRELARYRSIVAVHGGLSAAEQSARLERFTSGQATALLATDVAGQGLNLQHTARWVISFDLPWNPVKLEQRIGRVERLGQVRRVHLTLLLSRHWMEERLVSQITKRILAARHTLGTSALARLLPPDEAAAAGPKIDGSRLRCDSSDAIRDESAAWARPARAVARVMARRRTLRARWRAPQPVFGRPWIADRRRSGGQMAGLASVLLVTLLLVDGSGTEIERLVLPLAFDAGGALEDAFPTCTAVMAACEPRVRARMRRVATLVRVVADRHSKIEAALDCEFSRVDEGDSVALQLFDRGGERAFEEATRRRLWRREDLQERLAMLQRSSGIAAEVPRIEVVFMAGR